MPDTSKFFTFSGFSPGFDSSRTPGTVWYFWKFGASWNASAYITLKTLLRCGVTRRRDAD